MDDDLRPASRLDIAAAAALLSEPARVSIISALMDGQSRPATELAPRIARGASRVPGRSDTRSSIGAPTIATSKPASSAASSV